jgi:hypothetical protein
VLISQPRNEFKAVLNSLPLLAAYGTSMYFMRPACIFYSDTLNTHSRFFGIPISLPIIEVFSKKTRQSRTGLRNIMESLRNNLIERAVKCIL